MKKEFSGFCVLLSNIVLAFTFILGSFLLLVNVYHYNEINSSKYFSNIESNGNLVRIKSSIDSSLNRINAVSGLGSSEIASALNGCYSAIKNAKVYTLTGNIMISDKFIYDINNDFMDNVYKNCLFKTSEIILGVAKDYSLENYDDIHLYIMQQNDVIAYTSNYLLKRTLNNSEYKFTIDKISVFNELTNNFDLVLINYIDLLNTMDVIVDWYAGVYGGSV